jgi:uncharacterized protein
MNALRRGWKGCATLLIAGCASNPVHYHTLVPPPAGDESASTVSLYRIQIAPVRIPAQVDRNELVVRRSDGGITLADGELWIASLADELRGALQVELIRTLDSAGGVSSDMPPAISLRVEVERFESAPARYVLVEASWYVRVKSTHGEASLSCRSRTYRPVSGGGYDALVLAHQRAVASFADQIAAAVTQMASGGAAGCPV